MGKAFKVIIAGSRSFTDFELLCRTMDYMLSKKVSEGYKIIIISGTSKGADRLGEQYAKLRGYEVILMPADWETYGKRAGYVRNEAMANIADALVAFYNGTSSGTRHMIDIAKEKGLPYKVVLFKDSEGEPDIVAYFDGSSVKEGEKWVGAIGAVAYYGNSKIVEISEDIGEATCNAAEYRALIKLLEALLLYSNAHIVINGDSQLVINQVNGSWVCNDSNLKRLLLEVNELRQAFRKLHFKWTERESNTEADALSKTAVRR